MWRRYLILLILSLILSGTVFAFGIRHLIHAAESLPLAQTAWLFLFPLVGWGAAAFRIMLLSAQLGAPIGFFPCYGRVLAIEFSGAVTPGSIGLAPAFVWFNQSQRLTYTQSTALFTAEIVTDAIFWAFALPFIALFAYIDPPYWLILAGLALFFPLGSLVLWGGFRHHRHLLRWMAKIGGILIRLPRWRRRIAKTLVRVHRASAIIGRISLWRASIMYSCASVQWAARYAILPGVLWLLGHPIDWALLTLFQIGLFLFGQAVVLPGGGGGIEIAFTTVLSKELPLGTVYPALAIWRFYTYYLILLAGAPLFFLLSRGRFKLSIKDEAATHANE